MKKQLRRPMILAGLSILIGILPILLSFIALGIAHLNNCHPIIGSSHQCIILAINVNEILSAMILIHWLGIVSMPIGILGFSISMIWLSIEQKKA